MARERLWITGPAVYLPNRSRRTEMYRYYMKRDRVVTHEKQPSASWGLYLWGFLMMALLAGTLWLVLAVNGGVK